MAHDLANPRTKKYSLLKTFFIKLELLVKKIFYFAIIFINFFFHSKKKKILDLEDYNEDTRFINYLFYSLKNNYCFSYNVNFSVANFIKKIGVKNFILHCAPNFLLFKIKRKRFLVNSSNNFDDAINFNTNYFGIQKYQNSLYMPYYMYPKIYNNKYSEIEKLKNNKKEIRIFFSGSTNDEVYGKFNWHQSSNIKFLNRIEIIDFVIEKFKDKVFLLKSYPDIKNINYDQKKIILSINSNLIKKTKTNLTNDEHLDLISKSTFFLTAPGADMPLCHHFIEAIKLNSIPISNYAHLHKPILDNDSFLQFTDFNSLKIAIEEAIEMNNEEIFLKQKKIEYFYNNFLSPVSFCKKFESSLQNEVFCCNDVESLKWLN